MGQNTIGKAPQPDRRGGRHWVQTERAAHSAWAALTSNAPTAAALMHVLVAHMGEGNAVVASQSTLGQLLGHGRGGGQPVHRNTVRRALDVLIKERWLEVVQLGGKGGTLAYIVNSRVAWHGSRDGIRHARFTAQVLANEQEQLAPVDDRPKLREIPMLTLSDEGKQARSSDDEFTSPVRPAQFRDEGGQMYEVDPATGEVVDS